MRCSFVNKVEATTTSLQGIGFRWKFVAKFPELTILTEDDFSQGQVLDADLHPRRTINSIISEVLLQHFTNNRRVLVNIRNGWKERVEKWWRSNMLGR